MKQLTSWGTLLVWSRLGPYPREPLHHPGLSCAQALARIPALPIPEDLLWNLLSCFKQPREIPGLSGAPFSWYTGQGPLILVSRGRGGGTKGAGGSHLPGRKGRCGPRGDGVLPEHRAGGLGGVRERVPQWAAGH